MANMLEKIAEFNKANRVQENTFPGPVSKEEADLRYKLIFEELQEYKEAQEAGDTVGIADALGDLLYVVFQAVRVHGMSDIIEDVYGEIHRSNMTKLDDDGNPILNGVNCELDPTRPYGKVMKSKNYTPPNLAQFIK